MKLLKKPFRKLLHDQGNLHDRVNRLRFELDEVQKAIDIDPSNRALRDEETTYIYLFNEAKIDEERFLRQKAKIEWLEVGESNSAYFHKSIKSRNQRSRIDVITTADDIVVSGNSVPDVFVSNYESFLGTYMECEDLNINGLFHKQVSENSNANMVRGVTNEEIKKAMFDIGNDKAPGPDGYTLVFFKRGWDVVGIHVCNAIRDFFDNGTSKGINHTFPALIPKVVSENQSAFVPGRHVSDNILITQELMHNYHRDRGPPRCAFKVDIQKVKAYERLIWRFIWVSFSKGVRLSNTFRYHNHCEELEIINVCFADDLFIFARGDVESARVIMDSLDEFKQVSGLVPSIPKSTAFFCNVMPHVKNAILSIMPFSEVKAPNLALIATPNIDISRHDSMRWCDLNGNLSDFSVKYAWEVLRPRGQQPWDVDAQPDFDATLRVRFVCSQQDSHEHLFFECSYSSKVWNYIRNLAGMEQVPPVLDDIVLWFIPMANKRSFKNVVDLTNEEVEYLKLFEEEIEVSKSDEKMGDVCEWKTTWTTKRTPRIIDP
ncbi:hypothetical protein Tco_0733176 [Tanacetum coccineum]